MEGVKKEDGIQFMILVTQQALCGLIFYILIPKLGAEKLHNPSSLSSLPLVLMN